jgi:hypothetical protein
MKKQQNPALGVFDTGTSLQHLISNLVNGSLPVAFDNKTNIVNEVGHGVYIENNNEKVVTVMKDLLATVVQNSNKGDIHISAERYSDIVVLQIQERNNYNGYALAFSLMSIESQINETGGSLSIDGKQKKVATISYSFPNFAAA